MATPTDILTLTQWFSPAFPVGAFAYSHGMEWAIESGAVTDVSTATEWIETVLEHGSGWNDAVLIGAAFRACDGADLAFVDATARALSASRERLMETTLQGQAFCQTVSAVWGETLNGLCFPVAVGHAAKLQNLPVELTAQMYLQAFVSNLAACAMRLVPIGQTEGQEIIKSLTPNCAHIAGRAVHADLDDLGASSFLADIASMKHETQYSRVFRT